MLLAWLSLHPSAAQVMILNYTISSKMRLAGCWPAAGIMMGAAPSHAPSAATAASCLPHSL